MTHEELKSRLPHRDAMLLVGEVTTKDGDENTAVGKTYIRGDEWFLQGHFPGNPIVPGVMLYRTMQRFSEGDYEAATSALIATIIYAGCMAFAITLAAMLAKNFFPARLREKRTENDK